MAREASEILKQLGLDENPTCEEIINTLKSNNTVTDIEINNIINASVKPLPNVVKNNPNYVKLKMYGIVTDESLGLVAVLNKRMALMTCLVEKLEARIKKLENK